MMVLQAVCIFLCATVAAANVGPDDSVCKITDFIKQAGTRLGPKKPDLPRQWSVRIEANFLDSNYSMDMQEYYDDVGNRGAVIQWVEGVQTKLIFLYDTNELIVLQDNGGDSPPRCHVNDLAKSTDNSIFGMTKYANGTEHIFSASRALRFGEGVPEVPLGQIVSQDGITVDSWKSCSYKPDTDTTLLIVWQFSASTGWISADNVVVPVKASVKGAVHVNSTYTSRINREFIFSDFQTTLPVDVFTTPSGTYCYDRATTRNLPAVPSSFSVASEIVLPSRQAVHWRRFSYDGDLHLMRVDYTPDVTHPSQHPYNQLIYIRDFNTAWTYTVDTELGNCTVTQVTNKYNGISDQPEADLYRQDAFTYVGQRMSRGIRCDVFNALLPNDVKPNSVTELYMAARGWEENAGFNSISGFPVRKEVTSLETRNKTIYNYYDYSEGRHDIWRTDLSACFVPSQRHDFAIYFPVDHAAAVMADPNGFKQALVRTVYRHGNISPMQITNIQIITTKYSIKARWSYMYQHASPFLSTTMLYMSVDASFGLLYRDIDGGHFVLSLGKNITLTAQDITRT
ncbi:uncharacterized protein LOC124113180 isoform X1 [Haliotis rufescens]|uniref:uncharacterized protein LOC124113180 isoform X1 n=1 Tax=Haliotis rufescens TaxID=6454 RepID=UPI00201EE302|nr:uncharacterized protein LOC124113180 isoform X1 [Haliotis rufescens]